MTVNAAVVLAGLATGAAVAVVVPGSVPPRQRHPDGAAAAGRRRPPSVPSTNHTARRRSRWWLATAAAGFVATAFAGPGFGLAVGAAALLTFAGSSAAQGRARRRLALRRATELPQLLDVACLCLRAGAGVPAALTAAATTTPAYRQPVTEAVRRLRLGAPAEEAFGCWAPDAGLLDAGLLLAGHLRSGAPVAESLHELAARHRRERAARLAAQAREAAVAATLPTTCCFLPAFVLVGVVPLALALLARLHAL